MKVLQLIYTSCKKGMSGDAGFGTYSMSEGISNEEKREIEGIVAYEQTQEAKKIKKPTESQIENPELFPVSFIFFRLNSGRFCIAQSKYIGLDYSDRYGNFFAHVAKQPAQASPSRA